MNIKNAKNWSNVPRPQAYLVSLAITMAAFGIRYALNAQIAPYGAFQMFVVASLLIEYLVGFGPALLSAVLGLLLALHFFIPPYGIVTGISRSDVIVTFNYAFVTLFAIGLIEYLQRTLHSNQLLLKVSKSRHKISLYRENDRLYLAKKTAVAMHALEKLFSEFDRVLLFMPADGAFYPQPLLYRLSGRIGGTINDDALALFHPDDRAVLKTELSQLHRGDGRRELQLRISSEGATYRMVKLVLERISVDDVHASVLKMVEWNEPASSMNAAVTVIQDTASVTLKL
jgi:K+-sensing histidine kinase KdpD